MPLAGSLLSRMALMALNWRMVEEDFQQAISRFSLRPPPPPNDASHLHDLRPPAIRRRRSTSCYNVSPSFKI